MFGPWKQALGIHSYGIQKQWFIKTLILNEVL